MPPELRPFVRSVVGYAGAGLTPGVHRGLPGRSLTLVFALDARLGVAASAADWAAGAVQYQPTTLSGLHTEPAFVVQPGRWSGVQVDVSPLGTRRLFALPAAALPTDRFDGEAVLGADVARVHEQLVAAATWSDRYAVLLGWLLDLLVRGVPGRVRPEVVQAWRLLERTQGRTPVGQLADQVGLGPRRLAAVFRAEIGVTPKVAARLLRFDAARRDVTRSSTGAGPRDLTRVALRHGYYDHAHLVREFTAFTGLSPTGWLSSEVGNVQVRPDVTVATSSS